MAVTRIDDMDFSDMVDLPQNLTGDEIDTIIDDYNLMGYDEYEMPELMGGWLKRLFRKIRDRVRARKAARKATGEPAPEVSFSTARGQVNLSPSGMSLTKRGAGAGQIALSPSGLSVTQPYSPAYAQVAPNPFANMMEQFQKNPMLLAIPVGLIVLSIVSNRRRN